jgi:predicted ATPase/DNA-binding SARP family transcriptional activator
MIGVLGPLLVVRDDGGAVAVPSALRRLLLTLLAAHAGRIVTADELADWLWADRLPDDPRAALHSHVSRLRRRLGADAAWLTTVNGGYQLDCPPGHVDAVRFEQLIAAARERAGGPAAVCDRLEVALGLWRGPAYGEFAGHVALAPAAARLEDLRVEAVELRAEALMDLGRPAEAAAAMRRLSAEQPFRERPVALAMRALAQDGRHPEALAGYREFRRLLADELGVDPSPGLRAVEAATLGHGELARRLVPAVGVPGDSFVGRDAELARCRWLLKQHRQVTLVGAGGVGKTRLAVHVAAGVAERYPGGVYLCELADVTDPQAVPLAVASALHVEHRADRPVLDRVVEFLQVRRALLVLDNCEHVLAAAAEVVTAVLRRTPHVDVLATSRERLGVEGEHRLPVGPLTAPAWDDPDAAAAVLFADRMRAVRPDLELGSGDTATVAQLCRRLDGLPLAIELAAARTVSCSPAEVLAAVAERLDALADPRRPVARHRSLHAVVGWSHGLLGPGEREAFARLAVFAGGWTAQAAAEVAGAGSAELAELVERSLVTARSGPGTRFAMLEPVREYAEDRLREGRLLDVTRARHAAWAVGCAESADHGLRGPGETSWREVLTAELANLRAAQRWCLEHDPDGAVRLSAALYRHAWGGAPAELHVWARQTVHHFPDLAHPRLPAAYATAALSAWHGGDLAAARDLAEAGIAAAAQDPGAGRLAWEVLGDVETFLGHFDPAVGAFERAAALARGVGDHHQAAIAVLDEALCHAYRGCPDPALAACEAVAPVVAAVGNPSLSAWSDYVNGEVRLDGAPAEALPYLRRAVTAARRIGNRLIVGVAGLSAASGEARAGSPDGGTLARYGELIEHWDRDGAWNMQWATLRTLVELLVRVGRHAEAAVLHGAMTASPTAPPLAGADAARIGAAVAAARARLGAQRFAAASAEGAALSDAEAVAFARACVGGPLPAGVAT